LIFSTNRIPKSGGAIRQKIISLDKQHGLFKAAKFGLAGVSGFLVAEVILALGVLWLYGTIAVPSAAYLSPTSILLDIGALALGVNVAFFVNERFTFRVEALDENGRSSWLVVRLLKFQGVNAAGNAAALGITIGLMVLLSIPPVFGNIAGSVVAYPITYIVSMRFIWKATGRVGKEQRDGRVSESRNNVSPPSGPFSAIVILSVLYLVALIEEKGYRGSR
jgi:putative flippase GtrA